MRSRPVSKRLKPRSNSQGQPVFLSTILSASFRAGLARFMPGLRAPIYFTAGTVGVKFHTFLFYDGLAALVSVPAIVPAA